MPNLQSPSPRPGRYCGAGLFGDLGVARVVQSLMANSDRLHALYSQASEDAHGIRYDPGDGEL